MIECVHIHYKILCIKSQGELIILCIKRNLLKLIKCLKVKRYKILQHSWLME